MYTDKGFFNIIVPAMNNTNMWYLQSLTCLCKSLLQYDFNEVGWKDCPQLLQAASYCAVTWALMIKSCYRDKEEFITLHLQALEHSQNTTIQWYMNKNI